MLSRLRLNRWLSPSVACAAFCLLLGSAAVRGQDLLPKKSAGKQRVSFAAAFEPATAAPGATVQLKITATPLPDHYIYSLTQGDGGKPTVIQLSEFAGFDEVA